MRGVDSRPKAKIATRTSRACVAVLDAAAAVSYSIRQSVWREGCRMW